MFITNAFNIPPFLSASVMKITEVFSFRAGAAPILHRRRNHKRSEIILVFSTMSSA